MCNSSTAALVWHVGWPKWLVPLWDLGPTQWIFNNANLIIKNIIIKRNILFNSYLKKNIKDQFWCLCESKIINFNFFYWYYNFFVVHNCFACVVARTKYILIYGYLYNIIIYFSLGSPEMFQAGVLQNIMGRGPFVHMGTNNTSRMGRAVSQCTGMPHAVSHCCTSEG